MAPPFPGIVASAAPPPASSATAPSAIPAVRFLRASTSTSAFMVGSPFVRSRTLRASAGPLTIRLRRMAVPRGREGITELLVLGPLQVVDDGRVVALGSGRQTRLLARLVLHAGEVVSRDRLIDALWGERPPASA